MGIFIDDSRAVAKLINVYSTITRLRPTNEKRAPRQTTTAVCVASH